MRFQVIEPVKCRAHSVRSGDPCRSWAVKGATVCRMHGGASGHVKAAAARRVTLAEQMAATDRRHPLEVLASALHGSDVMARQVQAQLASGDQISADMVQALLDSLKTQATMAKLVLDAGGGPEQWSAAEAVRQQADGLARIVQETVRLLGMDPADPRVSSAFEEAVAAVTTGRKTRVRVKAQVRAIEGEVVEK